MTLKKNRDFQWVSSTKGDKGVLNEVNRKLVEFYSIPSGREEYQGMLNSLDDMPPPNDYANYILNYLVKKNAPTILEVGCANGRIFRQLRQSGYTGSYTGMEVAEYIIEQNKKRHTDADWVTAGAYSIPFENEKFDLCFAFFVLEHLVYPEKALVEMMRVVKKGGELVLVFPDFVKSGRLASQQLGLSVEGTAMGKLKKGKVLDALVSLYDSRIRLPKALKNIHKEVGPFPINTNLVCFNPENQMSPDIDAVYIASKEEIMQWATANNYTPQLPFGSEGELDEKAFVVIKK